MQCCDFQTAFCLFVCLYLSGLVAADPLDIQVAEGVFNLRKHRQTCYETQLYIYIRLIVCFYSESTSYKHHNGYVLSFRETPETVVCTL